MSRELTFPGELLARLTRFGRVHVLDTVTSTNDVAFSLASNHEAAIVIARHQIRGRGRFRRPWYSDEDSLTFSVLLFKDAPGFPPAHLVTHVAGLALCLAIEQVAGLKPLIRWPNDIVHDDLKLAGILCEARGSAIAIGVGLNVNQDGLPEHVPEAGSLRMVAGREQDRLALLEQFISGMTSWLERVGKGETPELWIKVKERSAVLHRRVEVTTLLRRYVGVVSEVDVDGRIVLRTDAGRLVWFDSGQVRRLR